MNRSVRTRSYILTRYVKSLEIRNLYMPSCKKLLNLHVLQLQLLHTSLLFEIERDEDEKIKSFFKFRFNRKPNKGIAFLQSHGMLGNAAVEVAEFVLNETRLNPSEVGDYLGENEK